MSDENISITMHSIESRLVIGPSNILFARRIIMCALFSPEILQPGAVAGLTLRIHVTVR